MAILTPDYERLQNTQVPEFDMVEEYRDDFSNQDIDSAQALITSDKKYLVMDADALNDLCDTLMYMQSIWESDKFDFRLAYMRMCATIECFGTGCSATIPEYNIGSTYNVGDIVAYNGNYYFCIVDNVTGTWDDSKWIRIDKDDVGLDFIGGSTMSTSHTTDELWVDTSSSLPTWYQGEDNIIGYTYPNMRYLTSNDTPYSGEIYMTDWVGGGN